MKLMSTLHVTHFANRIDFLLVPSRLVTKTDWHTLYFIQSLKFHPQITSWSTSFQALNGTLQCAISNCNSPLVNLSRSFQFPEPVYSTCLMSKTYWSTCTGPLIKVMQKQLASCNIHNTPHTQFFHHSLVNQSHERQTLYFWAIQTRCAYGQRAL
jgi:hypothetical protein